MSGLGLFSLVVDQKGNLWGCGENNYGQSGGESDGVEKHSLREIAWPNQVIAVAWGYSHALVLNKNGEVFYLGDDKRQQYQQAHKVDLSEIVSIACGFDHSIATNRAGEVFSWGNNLHSQLGIGDNIYRDKPIKIPLFEPVIKVACGNFHCIALTFSGELWSWGRNNAGQLGLGTSRAHHQSTPQKIIFNEIGSPPYFVDVACGAYHSEALTRLGELYTWGHNYHGDLGIGNKEMQYVPKKVQLSDSVVAVVSGYYHSLVLTKTGKVLSFGYNQHGQLGLSHRLDCYFPQEIPISNIVGVSCGYYHSMLVNDKGELFTFGCNDQGQLGHPSGVSSYLTPTKIPYIPQSRYHWGQNNRRLIMYWLSWCYLRFLFIGHKDTGSILSKLPVEIISLIMKFIIK